MLSTQIEPSAGRVLYRMRDGTVQDLWTMSEPARRFLLRTGTGAMSTRTPNLACAWACPQAAMSANA